MEQKKTFQLLFMFFSLLLLVMPIVLTFNDILTHIIDRFYLYRILQEKAVPIQVYIIGLLVKPFGVSFIAFKDGMKVSGLPLKISWNCLGWQSLLLFFISCIFGLGGARYSLKSKLKAVIIGLLGTFWINLIRLAFIVLLAAFARPVYRFVFHDYLAAFVTIGYLFFFWWFSYGFVLEEKV